MKTARSRDEFNDMARRSELAFMEQCTGKLMTIAISQWRCESCGFCCRSAKEMWNHCMQPHDKTQLPLF